jgi:hypothetical protein
MSIETCEVLAWTSKGLRRATIFFARSVYGNAASFISRSTILCYINEINSSYLSLLYELNGFLAQFLLCECCVAPLVRLSSLVVL